MNGSLMNEFIVSQDIRSFGASLSCPDM